jgi:hypothetical protein
METDNSILQAQREALRSFITVQERKTQIEGPVVPDRKKAEDAVRQQADASRRKVDEDRRGLDKLQAASTSTANAMMQSVNQSWNEVTSALRAAALSRLLSDPASFRVNSDGLGDPAQAMRPCQASAAEAQKAVERALIELRAHHARRSFIIFGMVIVVLVLFVVVAVKLG